MTTINYTTDTEANLLVNTLCVEDNVTDCLNCGESYRTAYVFIAEDRLKKPSLGCLRKYGDIDAIPLCLRCRNRYHKIDGSDWDVVKIRRAKHDAVQS